MIEQIIEIAVMAGEEALKFYKKENLQVSVKDDKSPVTEADKAAHEMITKKLSSLFPYPVISEEGDLGSVDSISKEAFWLVDPLDGTKEFIAKTDEFSINIALIRNELPVLGVIYSPVEQIVFYAEKGKGAFRRKLTGSPEPIKSHRPFQIESFTIVMSRRHESRLFKKLKEKWPGCLIEKLGSSLKLCCIAEGKADLYIRTGPTSLWDIAAGQIILEESGGKVVCSGGKTMRYKPTQIINAHFWAIGDKDNQSDFLKQIENL